MRKIAVELNSHSIKIKKGLIFFFVLLYLTTAWSYNDNSQTVDISKGWRFFPDEINSGQAEKWYAVGFDDSRWDIIDAGKSWEQQGYPDLDSYGWYRKVINIPSDWNGKQVWLKFSGVNDSYKLYVNGNLLTSFGDTQHTIFNRTTVAEIGRALKFGKKNHITVQVHDLGNSGGIWLPVVMTVDKNVVDADLLIYPFINYEKSALLLNINLASYMSLENDYGSLAISVFEKEGTAPVVKQKLKLADDNRTFLARIEMPQVTEKTVYNITIEIIDQKNKVVLSLLKKVDWNPPSFQADENHVKQLNNLVSELLNTHIKTNGPETFNFYNPRDGWVFFSINSDSENPAVTLLLNSLVLRINPETGAKESMQFLSEGEHTLLVNQAANSQLLVRSIPELIYSDHPSVPHIESYGPYDWDNYLTKYVLSNVNTIVTSAAMAKSERDQWIKEGRKWIVHAGLPGLSDPLPPNVKEVYESWSKNPGTTDSHLGGIIVDEFMHGGKRTAQHFAAWQEALTALYKNPDFSNKWFYAYCTPIFGDPAAMAIPFGKELVRNGGCFAIERYLNEMPTEEKAYKFLFEELSFTYKTMTKNLGVDGQKWIIALGYLTDFTETLNYYPYVDYRVYMDMQMHLLATDPTFQNLYGIQEYKADYADEELIRWAHTLYRHYFIEGKRTRYTNDPYLLPHIKNSFFEQGLQNWTVEQAEEGNILLQSLEGYSWLQGLYPRTNIGDQFIRLKRSANKPNTIRQTIKKLKPGRLYSIKLVAIDKNNMDKKQKLALSIILENAEIINGPTFHSIYPSNYSHQVGHITRDNPAWFNLQRIVFRPKSNTVDLAISDWNSPTDSGGPTGQEMIFNFVEIQPFYSK